MSPITVPRPGLRDDRWESAVHRLILSPSTERFHEIGVFVLMKALPIFSAHLNRDSNTRLVSAGIESGEAARSQRLSKTENIVTERHA